MKHTNRRLLLAGMVTGLMMCPLNYVGAQQSLATGQRPAQQDRHSGKSTTVPAQQPGAASTAKPEAGKPRIRTAAEMARQPAAPGRVYNNNNEYKAQTLKELPDTPFLPPYPGKKETQRVRSWKRPDGGASYNVIFSTKDKDSDVIDWYRSNFEGQDWKVDPKNPSPRRLSARHGSNIFSTILVMRSGKKGCKTEVHMRYRIVGTEL